MDALTHADGVYRKGFSYALEGIACNGVHRVGEVLYVDFSAAFARLSAHRMAMALMVLIGTYTRFSEITHVLVTCEGEPLYLRGYDIRPVLALENRYLTVDDLLEEFENAQQQFNAGEPIVQEQVSLILYEKTNTGLLAPTLRTVHVSNFAYCETAISEMLRMPEKPHIVPLYGDQIVLRGPCEYFSETGTLKIGFEVSETADLDEWNASDQLAATAIHLFPHLERLQVAFYVPGQEAPQREIEYELPAAFYRLAQEFMLEVPAGEGAIFRAVPFYCGEWENEAIYRDVLQHVWAYDSPEMESIRSACGLMPETIQSGVLHIWEEGETVVADLSSAMREAFLKLPAEEERLLVYAMVNSLLNVNAHMQRVHILFNGRSVPYFSGKIRTDEPLFRLSGVTVS